MCLKRSPPGCKPISRISKYRFQAHLDEFFNTNTGCHITNRLQHLKQDGFVAVTLVKVIQVDMDGQLAVPEGCF